MCLLQGPKASETTKVARRVCKGVLTSWRNDLPTHLHQCNPPLFAPVQSGFWAILRFLVTQPLNLWTLYLDSFGAPSPGLRTPAICLRKANNTLMCLNLPTKEMREIDVKLTFNLTNAKPMLAKR